MEADAVDENRIKNKIKTDPAKASEFNFCLVFICPTPYSLFNLINFDHNF